MKLKLAIRPNHPSSKIPLAITSKNAALNCEWATGCWLGPLNSNAEPSEFIDGPLILMQRQSANGFQLGRSKNVTEPCESVADQFDFNSGLPRPNPWK